MSKADEIIEQAKKEDWMLHIHRREARIEQRRLVKEGPYHLPFKEAYKKACEINSCLKDDNGTYLSSVHLPTFFRDLADALVLAGIFPNRSEIYRTAIREYLKGWIDITEFED